MSRPGELVVTGTGVDVEVGPAHRAQSGEFLEERVRVATKRRRHLWTAVSVYELSVDELERQDAERHLDSENLLSVHVGCVICEQSYSTAIGRTPCPGDPS